MQRLLAPLLAAIAVALVGGNPVGATILPGDNPVAVAHARAGSDPTWKKTVYVATGSPVEFSAAGSVDWDYENDPEDVLDTIDYDWRTASGVFLSSSSSFTHNFSQAGDLTINLKITDTPGNNNDVVDGTDTVYVKIRALGGPIEVDDDQDLLLLNPESSSPTYSFTRHSGQPTDPSSPTYAWSITAGSDKAEIVGSTTGASVQVRGTAKSLVQGDITLSLDYTWQGIVSTSTVNLTVCKPSTVHSTAHVGTAYRDPWGPATWRWGQDITFTVRDQLGRSLGGVLWDETCWLTYGGSGPTTQGDRHTPSSGVIEDEHSYSQSFAPDGTTNLLFSVRQKVVVGGWSREGEDCFWGDDFDWYQNGNMNTTFFVGEAI